MFGIAGLKVNVKLKDIINYKYIIICLLILVFMLWYFYIIF